MRKPTPPVLDGRPDPALLHRVNLVQRVCLGSTAVVAGIALIVWMFPAIDRTVPAIFTHMRIPFAFIALFCAVSLLCTEAGRSAQTIFTGRVIISITAFFALIVQVTSALQAVGTSDSFLDAGNLPSATGSAMQPAAAFVFLSVVVILIDSSDQYIKRAADVFVSCLCLLVLVLLAQTLYGVLGIFGLNTSGLISPQALLCFVLLTIVVSIRQAEHGVFSIFLGRGIGSRIARGFAPILLLLPFLGELSRTQTLFTGLIPMHYANAVLTAMAAAIFIMLLVFLVWRIDAMETEIHDLTLRDELTGLYNMRGFYLLAEQTLRLAQRAQLPFSVLFIDLDNLKLINDRLGHNAGSAYLAETGELVDSVFREGDVKGRFGGDEFVVAGQFSVFGISIAAQRLGQAADERTASQKRNPPLSFSIGYVTLEHYSQESLKELIARADEAMYREKRRKKAQALAARAAIES